MTRKRILSLLLTFVMVLSLLPGGAVAVAADGTEGTAIEQQDTAAETENTALPENTDGAEGDDESAELTETPAPTETPDVSVTPTDAQTDSVTDPEQTTDPVETVYTVTFEVNGGSEVEAKQVKDGETAEEPENPTKEGFTFGGWFEDGTCVVAFDFATPITADVKVYAKWDDNTADDLAIAPKSLLRNGDPAGGVSSYTVVGLNATATFAYEPGNPAYAIISDTSIPVFSGDSNPPSSYYRLSAGPLFRDLWLDVPQWGEPYSGQTVYGRLTLQTTSECPSDILIDYENMDKDQVNISIEGYTVTVLGITSELIDGRSVVRILYAAKRNGNIVGLNLTIGGFRSIINDFGKPNYFLDDITVEPVISGDGYMPSDAIRHGSGSALYLDRDFTTPLRTELQDNETCYGSLTIIRDEDYYFLPVDFSYLVPDKVNINFDGYAVTVLNVTRNDGSATTIRYAIIKTTSAFTTQPQGGMISPGEHHTVTWATNFTPVALYRFKDGVVDKTFSDPKITLDSIAEPGVYKYRAHFGTWSHEYVDSDEFTVSMPYTITFRPNGGNYTPTSATTGTDGKLTSLPTITRTGYTFKGWYTALTGGEKVDLDWVYESDTVLYARWEKDIYTITFDPNGGSVTPTSAQTGEDGRLASLPTPTREGYSFKNWCSQPTGGYSIGISRIYTEDTTIYAQWDKKSYTVSFDTHSGSAVSPQIVEYGGKAVRPAADPTKGGWDFTGWYEDAACTKPFDFSKPIKANTTIHAGWEPFLIQFTVNFDVDDGTPVSSQTVTEGGKVTKPADPTKSGFTFAGWYANARKTVSFDFDNTEIYANTTIYARWYNPATTKLYVNFMKGTRQLRQLRVYNGDYVARPTAAEVEKMEELAGDGSVLEDWYTDATYTTKFDFDQPITSDTRIYGKWLSGYTVTFRGYSKNVYKNVEAGKTVSPPTNPPVRDGYVFLGWYTEWNCINAFDFSTPINENKDLHIKEAKAYTASFNTYGGSDVDVQTVYKGGVVTQPAAPTKNGYGFFGWYTDAELTQKYDFTTEVSGDIMLHAKWLPAVIGLHLKTDRAVKNGTNYKLNVDQLDTIFHPAVTPVTLDTLEITDLYTDQACTAALTTAPATGTAYYFAVNMQAGDDDNPLVFWDDAIKTGGCITGATDGQIEFVELYRSPNSGSATVVFKYTKTDSILYSITVNNGSADKTTAEEGATVKLTAAPAPLGKEFDKWIVDGGDISLADATAATTTFTMPAENVGVTATYKDLTYTVTFKDGDAILSTVTVIHGGSVAKPATDPGKDGNSFEGWYEDPTFNVPFDFDQPITANASVYAKFSPITVTGISIATPGKTAYTVGDALDVSGMEIKVDYSDGTSKTIPVTAAMVSGFDSSAPATSQTLTITYEGKTTTYDVSISAAAPVTYDITVNVGANGTASASAASAAAGTTITITATPNSGYEIDKITCTPEGGSTTDITSTKSFTMPAAKVTVDVSFKASSVTPPGPATVTGISLVTPGKTAYTVGEMLDVSGMEIKVDYSDGTSATIPVAAAMVSGFDSSAPATSQTLTITYDGKTTTYDVSISAAAPVTYDITVNAGANGTASASAASATAGTTITITATPNGGYEIDKITWTPDGGTATDITSTKSFEMPAKKVTVDVSFKASSVTPPGPPTVTGISLVTPGKTAYTVGETLDVSGMEIKVDYSDGTSATIPVAAAMVSGFDSSAPATSQTLTITYEGKTTTYNVSISATAPVTYDITVNVGANGTASASAASAAAGTTITITATPNSGYEIDKITCTPEGGTATDITSSKSFTMPAAKVTVAVSFKASSVTPPGPATVTGISLVTPGKTAYTVGDALDVSGMKIKVDYSDGTSATIPVAAAMVSGFDSSAPATSQTLTITYEGKTTTYDVSISAAAPVTYDITVNAGAGGTANASASKATAGTTITITATPNGGYEIDKITCTPEGGTATDITSSKSFTMPAAKVTVAVSFKASSVTPPGPTTYTVTFKDGDSVLSTVTVNSGEKVAKPADPTKTDHTFNGWYADATFTAAFDFDQQITANATVYAKFTKNSVTPPATITYSVTGGADTTWTKGSNASVTITVKRGEADDTCFSHFTGVEIDGVALAAGDYEAVSGSTVVTLKASALQKLSNGSHTVTVKFDDGKASTGLTVKAASGSTDKPTSPQTGDESNMLLWLSMMILSLLVIVLVLLGIRKERPQRHSR